VNGNFWDFNDNQTKEKLQEKWLRSKGPQNIVVIEKIVLLVQTYSACQSSTKETAGE
jgi:hypothetical protein